MKPLDQDKNWELFCRKTFKQEHCPYPELESVGTKIARSCKGLPLSVVVIGGLLLKSPKSLQFWENFACNVRQNHNSKEKQESLDVLSLSYTHLPPRLKPCFLYMGVFEEDSEISVSNIIRRWVVNGFIRPTGNNIPEEIAEGFIKELIDRNLIFVRKRRKNGKIGTCGVHDLVRDLCLKVGGELEFFSYAGFNNDYYCGVLDDAGNISSLSLVWHRQTLVVDKILMLKDVAVAPTEFWRMRQLRHVKCFNIDLPHPPSLSNGSIVMDNLQSLKAPVNLRLSEEVCQILPNIKKLHLCYYLYLQGYDDSLIECLQNLDCLQKLESLSLGFRYSLEPIMRARFPNSLNKLTLKSCKLECEHLSMIGSLPHLQVLEMSVICDGGKWSPIDGQFLRLKYLQMAMHNLRYWYTDKSHFPVLEKLVLFLCKELKEIPLSIGEIPTLELISVNCCSNSAAISALKIKEAQLENQGDDDGLQVELVISDFRRFNRRVKALGLTLDNVEVEVDDL